mgnify:CR=1 FL=1
MRNREKTKDMLFQSTLPMRGETAGFGGQSHRLHTFQSTLPMRGETNLHFAEYTTRPISIHSPHAGRDYAEKQAETIVINFNPLSPCGERPNRRVTLLHWHAFQSTLPMRGETCNSWWMSTLK